MAKINVTDKKKIHFIGIGGIGVSALARMFLLQGKMVSGSDMSAGKITEEVEKKGGKVFIEHTAENLPEDADLVIYTIAVKEDNPEYKKAKELGVDMLSYPETLGVISENKFTIAVSGTHGKTTTTGMIAKILIDAGLEPTVIVGSLIKDKDGELTNFIYGNSNYFLVEACEYRRSFINLEPNILVVTNIDSDHLDYYKDIEDIKSAFGELVGKMTSSCHVIIDRKQKNLEKVIEKSKSTIVDFGLADLENTVLKVPGEHNREDARAALVVGEILGINKSTILKSLSEFTGTWRRFEFLGENETGAKIYTDYGHHPTEINATLEGAREMFKDKQIKVLFQPHLYSRTKQLLSEFAGAFNAADEVFLAPIYGARELPDPEISSEILADLILKKGKTVKAFSKEENIEEYIENSITKDDVLITMGAGDIYKVGESLVRA